MSNLNKKINPYEIVRQYFHENCIDWIKYYLKTNPEDSSQIRSLIKDAINDELEYLTPNDFGCPIKFALSFFEKINEETIKKALANVDFTEYSEGADLLGTSELILYLANKCKYINHGAENENVLSLLMIANIYITLGLSKDEFLEYTRSVFSKYVRQNKAERIWNIATNLPKAIVCKNCCEDFKFNNSFDDNNKDEEETL